MPRPRRMRLANSVYWASEQFKLNLPRSTGIKITNTMDAKLTIDKTKNTATIVIPLNPPRTSASGATVSIAETRNQQTDVVHDGKAIKLTVQVYYKP